VSAFISLLFSSTMSCLCGQALERARTAYILVHRRFNIVWLFPEILLTKSLVFFVATGRLYCWYKLWWYQAYNRHSLLGFFL